MRSNKEYFESAYNNLLEAKKKEKEENEAQTAKQSQELEKSILNDKNLLGGVSIDVNMRKKIVENIMNPAYKMVYQHILYSHSEIPKITPNGVH